MTPKIFSIHFSRSAKYLLSSKKILFGTIIVTGLILISILAPIIAPFDPNQQNRKAHYNPPFWFPEGSTEHILGTDSLGRDVFSRLIYSSQAAVYVAVVGTIFTALIGSVVGVLAGYYRGRVDEVNMRIVDAWMSFPAVLLSIALISILGVGLQNVALAVIVVDWSRFARVIRSETLNIREEDYIQAARSLGFSDFKIIRKEILPNLVPILTVVVTIEMSIAITVEVLLSYVGLGVKAFTPSWGSMIAEGMGYVQTNWWVATFPMMTLILVILSINILGEGAREKLDPKIQTN